MRLEVVQDVSAPRQRVWELLTSWERQPEWMLDARAVEVLTPQRTGEGVTLVCPTRLFGFTVRDVMRVTGWAEPAYLEVTHLGKLIRGRGAFELAERGDTGTRITWWEEVDPPLGRVGRWGASALVLPAVRRVFARSLRRFAAIAEAPAVSSPAVARARPPRRSPSG